MRYLLLHTSSWAPAAVRPALESAQIESRDVRTPRDLVVDERPTVFVLDSESRSAFPLDVLRAFIDAGGAIVALGRNGETDVPAEMPAELLSGFVRQPVGTRQLLVAVRAGYREAAARVETARARAEAASRSREIGELTRIGVALGTERDLKTLLELIVTQARRITTSDAAACTWSRQVKRARSGCAFASRRRTPSPRRRSWSSRSRSIARASRATLR